jgi:hypothetical protein
VQKHSEPGELSYELIKHITNAITGGVLLERETASGKSVVKRLFDSIDALRATNKSTLKITTVAVREALARVMRVVLSRTIRTGLLLKCMYKDPELATSVVSQARSSPLSAEASAAILCRLVDFSTAAKAARKEIEVIKKAAHRKEIEVIKKAAQEGQAGQVDQADSAPLSKAGVDPRIALNLIETLIESAHDALLESLRRATGPSNELMYDDPQTLARTVIDKLKVGPYDRIVHLSAVRISFIQTRAQALKPLIDKYGPLCLWDVSAITDFTLRVDADFGKVVGFNSDLYWNTRSAITMSAMFIGNEQFKGYIGTWDVRNVRTMVDMFYKAGIEDSGIGSWNTESLTDAEGMFKEALSLRADLARWVFGTKPNMRCMFRGSGIVDCGIGAWNVADANTTDMLRDAKEFTGRGSLTPPNWPEGKRNAAFPWPKNKPKFGAPVRIPREEAQAPQAAASSTSTSAAGRTTVSDSDIAELLENAGRARKLRRREQKNDGPPCVIL